MNMVEGLTAGFGIAAILVFFIGSLILVKGLKERYLTKPNRDELEPTWTARHR